MRRDEKHEQCRVDEDATARYDRVVGDCARARAAERADARALSCKPGVTFNATNAARPALWEVPVSHPYRPEFVEVNTRAGGASRVHGRCPHCKDVVAVIAPQDHDLCRSCQRTFRLLDILPLTRIAL
jgi:hypothetical protein